MIALSNPFRFTIQALAEHPLSSHIVIIYPDVLA